MLKAARAMPVLDTEAQLGAWLRRVIHRAALDRLRADARRLRREREHSAAHGQRLAEVDERLAWLKTELAKLGPDERRLLVLRFGLDRSLRQTGAAAGLSDDAAHGRIRRSLDRLRNAAKELLP